MELFREIKLNEAIREAGKALAPAWGILNDSSLANALNKVKKGKQKSPAKMLGSSGLLELSPETVARCTQDLSEPVLLNAIRERGGSAFFHTELVSFTQNEKGVTAHIRNRDTGERSVIRADWMIAADGARSMIREDLNAETVGKGTLGNLLNIYFEADLAEFVRGREFSLLLIKEPGLTGMLATINNADRWVFHLYYDPSKGESPEDFNATKVVALLQQAIGLPGLKIRIISILPWQPTEKVLVNMRHGRIFFAGDAAHVMTPYGGKGANTGVQDAHNLAWKLAMVINGTADSSLLDSYSAERQPVGRENSAKAAAWTDKFGLLAKGPTQMLPILYTILAAKLTGILGMKKLSTWFSMQQTAGLLGLPDYRYHSPAIINEQVKKNDFEKASALNGQPGTRLPHVWVEYQNKKISTIDLPDGEWLLLTGTNNQAWLRSACNTGNHSDILLKVYCIGISGSLIYKDDTLQNVFGIEEDGALLVRPDGFIAWRSVHFSDDLLKVLLQLCGKMVTGHLMKA